ncbi:extracellular solute-binding protein [Bacillus sp. FSL K6-3431]|uniref:extracellular solute-binding protein n=1 Tax=Bacillus sp. FSL K6-3431 TaxID=2921500 RepID=UPI0030F9BF48
MGKYKNLFLFVLTICFTMLLISCSNNKAPTAGEKGEDVNGQNESNEPEPFTLEIGVHFDETMFKERFKDPIEEHFPYITVEQVPVFTYGRNDLEELFSSGKSPDFFFSISQQDMEYFELDSDMDELLTKHNIDLSHVNENLLDTLRARDKEGRLIAWPYEDTYYVLAYNKDIFDMFGEAYPSDDMTWEETIELTKKLTKERDGVQYRGLDFADNVALSQLSVNMTDPDTGEVLLLDQPEFSQYLNLYKGLFDIPGQFEAGDMFNGDRFSNERTTAMLVINAQALNWYKDNESLHYDIAAVPTWSDHPGVAPTGYLQTLTMNPNSKHKDDVMKIFNFFISDEYQTWMSRNGIGIVSDKKEVLKEFYKDYENTHDKNVPAIFKNSAAPPPERISLWDGYVDLSIQKFYESNMDVNEFLRVTKEESEAKINEAKESE